MNKIKLAANLFNLDEKNITLHEVKDDRMSAKFKKGDIVVVDMDRTPVYGDFTLFEYKNENYLLWLLGRSESGYIIVCDQYVDYPAATPLRHNRYRGVVAGTLPQI